MSRHISEDDTSVVDLDALQHIDMLQQWRKGSTRYDRLNLLLACKAIYNEAKVFPFEFNTFNIVSGRVYKQFLQHGDYHARLSPLPIRLLHSIRHLRLNADIEKLGPVFARFAYQNPV